MNVFLTYWTLQTIPNYTHTLPSGQTPGKVWRRLLPSGEWMLGIYGEPDAHSIPIYWLDVVLIEGPAHPMFSRVDWHNTAAYLASKPLPIPRAS